MAESKLGQIVSVTVGGILLFALMGSLVSCGLNAVNEARNPELAVQRRDAEAASRAANLREEAVRTAEKKARDAEHTATMRAYAERARENEKRCIRQLGPEECRRIYRPTAEETAAQLAIVERAGRVAEAYRDE